MSENDDNLFDIADDQTVEQNLAAFAARLLESDETLAPSVNSMLEQLSLGAEFSPHALWDAQMKALTEASGTTDPGEQGDLG